MAAYRKLRHGGHTRFCLPSHHQHTSSFECNSGRPPGVFTTDRATALQPEECISKGKLFLEASPGAVFPAKLLLQLGGTVVLWRVTFGTSVCGLATGELHWLKGVPSLFGPFSWCEAI
jgi:hypothetical protein